MTLPTQQRFRIDIPEAEKVLDLLFARLVGNPLDMDGGGHDDWSARFNCSRGGRSKEQQVRKIGDDRGLFDDTVAGFYWERQSNGVVEKAVPIEQEVVRQHYVTLMDWPRATATCPPFCPPHPIPPATPRPTNRLYQWPTPKIMAACTATCHSTRKERVANHQSFQAPLQATSFNVTPHTKTVLRGTKLQVPGFGLGPPCGGSAILICCFPS